MCQLPLPPNPRIPRMLLMEADLGRPQQRITAGHGLDSDPPGVHGGGHGCPADRPSGGGNAEVRAGAATAVAGTNRSTRRSTTACRTIGPTRLPVRTYADARTYPAADVAATPSGPW